MEVTEKSQSYFKPHELKTHSRGSRPLEIHELLEHKIGNSAFPCVGAKHALNSGEYRIGTYGRIDDPTSADQLSQDLIKYIDETIDADSTYMTMIAVFTNKTFSEVQFEQQLWQQLAMLKAVDPKKEDNVEGISKNPGDSNYSFTFNGEAFYVVGMHYHSSREARWFPYPTMAFNLHKQFNKLRDNNTFDKMKDVIRRRDIALQGSINPMLSDFGEGLEAPQYSGRQVSGSWKCPYH